MLFNLAYLQQHYDVLIHFYAQSPFFCGLLFFLVFVFVTAFSVPVATLLTLLAGAIFGFGVGVLLVSFASSLGATLAMLISRHLLSGIVRRRFGKRMREIDTGITKDGAYYLFALRLTPIIPFFMVNILMGLTSIKTWTFYAVSQLGMLVLTVLYVNAGMQLRALHSLSGLVSPMLLGSLTLVGLFPLVMRKIMPKASIRD